MYVNKSLEQPLSHPKNTHFRLVPVAEGVASPPLKAAAVSYTAYATAAPSVLSQIKVNTSLLSPEQLKYLNELHQANIDAFGGDAASVTLFGEDTGAAAATLLALSPLADGLFHVRFW